MKALKQAVNGRVYRQGNQTVLFLDETAGSLFLRYALLEMYTDKQILPALLLDDWGKEVKTLAVYDWIRQYGLQFPRAELFGFDREGRKTQCFLRDLDLQSRLPCYAYEMETAPLPSGHLVEAVLLPGESPTPERIKRPSEIVKPLRYAQVSWWRVQPASLDHLDFSFLG